MSETTLSKVDDLNLLAKYYNNYFDNTTEPNSNPIMHAPITCIDILLASATKNSTIEETEINKIYSEYFKKEFYSIFEEELSELKCNKNIQLVSEAVKETKVTNRPNRVNVSGCLPPVCTILGGVRGSIQGQTGKEFNNLLIGDIIWLYYYEKMGIFKIISKIVNDYAVKGSYSIATGNFESLVLEIWTTNLKSGNASMLRDRESVYRRCLGWTLGLKDLKVDSEINTAFNSQFHKFLYAALGYYKQLRLAEAIRGTDAGFSSTGTKVEIKEILISLQESFDSFYYGRNYMNTVKGIVYCISAIALIKDLKDDIGISSSYNQLSQYIPAAFTKVVEGKNSSSKKVNRYLLHQSCAGHMRDLLNDIHVFDLAGEDVGDWLLNDVTEERIESYRKAYHDLTGVDLSVSIDNIPQEAS